MLIQKNNWQHDKYFQELFDKTILHNKYIPKKIKKGILDYPQEMQLLYELNNFTLDPGSQEPLINEVLCGGGRFGGKTLMGAVEALQFIEYPEYTCTVTRSTYKDLLAKGKDSIYGYIELWQKELNLPKEEKLSINKHDKTITSPEGGLINFMAFNYDDKADSLQSKSNKRIIADEALQLSLNILQDFKPTLRQGLDEYYPLSISYKGNPQLNNEEVNSWFGKTFVKGDLPYINMDLNNNPLINREAYKNSFKGLNKAKREAFLSGNFFYKPQVGDLITQEDLNKARFNTKNLDYTETASILFMDLAGRGKDKFAVSTITLLKDGRRLIDNITQTKLANATSIVTKHIREDNERGVYPSLAVLEMEGGSWVYTENFWKLFFKELNIGVKSSKPVGSKYMRAIPVSEELIEGYLLINKCLESKYYLEDTSNDYFTLFSDEAIGMLPLMKISPNIMDTISLGINFLRKAKISI